jgi:hypothetical protein
VPTPTSVLDAGRLPFEDTDQGLAFDYPLWWEPQSVSDAVTRFFRQNQTGAREAILTLTVLDLESADLGSALESFDESRWGSHVLAVQDVMLGAFDALRVELEPGGGRPPVVWLMATPEQRVVSILPSANPDIIKNVVEVALATMRPIESVAAIDTATVTPPPTPTPWISPTPTQPPSPTPWITPTPAPGGTPQAATGLANIREPLLIDGERGWIFASAQVNGITKTVKLSTLDGRLLQAYDSIGKLALDRAHNRLFVDQGAAGVAILDAVDGTLQSTVVLPESEQDDANPQVDPTSGVAYAFRGTSVFVIDPVAGSVSDTVNLSIPLSVCGPPGPDAPIVRSFYDLVNRKFYLSLVTYVCTPWVQHTIIAYDVPSFTELGRYGPEMRYQAVPFSDSLYGSTAGRLGRNVSWAFNGQSAWYEEGEPYKPLQGIVADWGRQLIYEAVDGQIRVFTPYPREALAQTTVGFLANQGRLVGHDPITDHLYFLVGGALFIQPTTSVISLP